MRRLWPLLLAGALCSCSRAYYRTSADRETYAAVAQHLVSPSANPGRLSIDPPSTSRLHDPTHPDHPPRPPDDPSAARFMERPDGRRGSRRWDRDGRVPFIESLEWEQSLPLDSRGVLRLDAATATDLALLHSRDYQTALEEVYLSALTLTLNRFEFDMRWFLRRGVLYTHAGSGSVPGETNTLDVSSRFGFEKTFAAGGQLLVDLANNFVWEFTGRQYRVNSNLLINFAQPLLRNGGRIVRLEALTQAERNVLYALRDFVRFRKQFWAEITTNPGGYLGLLLRKQELLNLQANLASQEQNLRLHEELFSIRGAVSVVQKDEAFQSYQRARLSMLQAEVDLQNAYDEYKVALGLPPRVQIELDNTPLEQFQLIAPALEKLREDGDAFQKARFAEIDSVPTLASLGESYRRLREAIKRAPALVSPIAQEVSRWGERLEKGEDMDGGEPLAERRKKYAQFREEHPQLIKDLETLDSQIGLDGDGLTEANRKGDWESLLRHVRRFLALLDQAIAMQTQVRINLIELPSVQWTEATALGYARENRLDLQNTRARTTDAWRRVAVAANLLRSELGVTATANLATGPDAKVPYDFSAEASRYAVGLQFDGPLNRQAERNAYRASQIAYQRARRDFMLLTDRIEQAVRRDLRALQLERVRFELARQSLLSAARQVEAARVNLQDQRDPTSTNRTRDVLQALENLLQARNGLANSYINYEQQRVQLLLDLEALQVDPQTNRVDK